MYPKVDLPEIIDAKLNVEQITKDDAYYFFGYYDLQPFSSDEKKHLTHRVSFQDRLPSKDDICELGYIDLETKEFVKLSETTAWNFQQGALLQWYRGDDQIVYNIRKNNGFGTEILNIKTGEKRQLPLACANISKDGKWGLCLNFSRIYDFRPGYGYSDVKDPFYEEKAPTIDGVFLMNMETGEYRLLISYADIIRQFPEKPYSDCKLVVNHITLNPSGNRFLMLFRNFQEENAMWNTQLITSDLDGNMCLLSDYISNSHYHWKNDSQILIVTSFGGEHHDNLCLRDDFTGKTHLFDHPELHEDIHCLYSPDRRYILGDGYAKKDYRYRKLWLLDTVEDRVTLLLQDYSYRTSIVDNRCDLHARWSPSGKMISYDTNHSGYRGICLMGFDV